jgi:hypothetical protein
LDTSPIYRSFVAPISLRLSTTPASGELSVYAGVFILLGSKQDRPGMEQLYRVRQTLRGVNVHNRILTIPRGATLRVIVCEAGEKWATVEWNGVQVRVFNKDLEERTESITAAQ